MPFVQRPGQPDLYYAEDDFPDPWLDALILILLHGYCRTSEFWYRWVPVLCRKFRVIRPDLRGLGRSPRQFDLNRDLTFDAYVEDLHAIVDSLGGGPVHLCGESFGGTIEMAFAARYPALVKSLTIVSSPVFLNEASRKTYACGHESWPAALRAMGPRAWLANTNGSTRFPPDTPPEFLAWYIDGVAAAGEDMLIRFAEIGLSTDLRPLLPQIAAPTLVLLPSGGVIADDSQRAALAAGIRDIRFSAMPTSYHMINFILPERCAAETMAFAESVESKRRRLRCGEANVDRRA